MAAQKRIAICADDFGVDPAVNDAIVELAGQARLTATSVLVDARITAASVRSLQMLDLDIGLHLNFTEVLGDLGASDVMPLGQLIGFAHLRRLPGDWLLRNIERQLHRFEDLFGRAPDYVDGHLHIHQLPQVREVLVQQLAARELPAGFWLRDTRAGALRGAPWSERFKATIIGHLGMGGLARLAQHQDWSLNRGFFGVYDFTQPHRPFERMLSQWLGAAKTGALIMAHPSNQAIPGDPIGTAREAERLVLGSPAFGDTLQAHHVSLARLTRIDASPPA